MRQYIYIYIDRYKDDNVNEIRVKKCDFLCPFVTFVLRCSRHCRIPFKSDFKEINILGQLN